METKNETEQNNEIDYRYWTFCNKTHKCLNTFEDWKKMQRYLVSFLRSENNFSDITYEIKRTKREIEILKEKLKEQIQKEKDKKRERKERIKEILKNKNNKGCYEKEKREHETEHLKFLKEHPDFFSNEVRK